MNLDTKAWILFQGLQFHIKRIHENTGKHFCDRCPFKAITRPELEIHINEVHTKSEKFHCDQCSFFCYRKGGLAAHKKNVHLKLRPHKCDVCAESCTLAWKAPADDGGCPIQEYKVEMLCPKTKKWKKIGMCKPEPPLRYPVTDLQEGEEYKFR